MNKTHRLPPVAQKVTMLENLPILSWNIHDSVMSQEGPKMEYSDFVDILAQSSVFACKKPNRTFFSPTMSASTAQEKALDRVEFALGYIAQFQNK